MARILCLINPASGGGRGNALFSEFQSLRSAGRIDGEARLIDWPNVAQQLRNDGNFGTLLIAGGDGTISSLLQDWRGEFPAIGLLPLGTGNDLARELKVPRAKHLLEYLTYYAGAQPRQFAVWRLKYGETSRDFCNYVSWGFDAAVVRDFSTWRESDASYLKRLGVLGNRLGYALAALRNLKAFLPIGIKVNGVSLPPVARALLLSNIRSIMGLGYSSLDGNCHDAQLEAQICAGLWSYPVMMARSVLPIGNTGALGGAARWVIEFPDGVSHVQLDGEAWATGGASYFEVQHAGFVPLIG